MSKDSGNKLSKNSCVIYCRVSTREQVDTMSLSSQERCCREFAQKNDMPIEKVFVEEGKSARTAKRPQLQEMSQYCFDNKDRIKAVVMYRLDRLMRDNFEYYTMKATLKSLGIRLVYATQSMINNTSEGELMEGLLSSTSQYESSIIGRRAKDGMTEARRHGRLTNAPPIGYKWQRTNLESERGEVVADPARAPLVTEAFMQYDAGSTDVGSDRTAHQKTRVHLSAASENLRSAEPLQDAPEQDICRICVRERRGGMGPRNPPAAH